MVKLPKEWEKHPLDSVASVQTGLAKGKKSLSNPVSLPYLRVANVQDGYFDLSEIKYIEVEEHQIGRYSLQDKDVLLTEGGDFDKLGRGSIWRKQFEPCLHQNHVFVVRTNPKKLIPEFFTCLSSSDYGKAYFLSCSKQSTNLASINSTQLKGFPVIVPPLEEQHKIINVLSKQDQTIEQVATLLEAKREHKRALMQRLLAGKLRFPEFADQPWQEIPLGKILKESRIPDRENDPRKRLTVRLHLKGVAVREFTGKEVEEATAYFMRKAGQLIYGKQNLFRGSLGIVPKELDGYCSSQDIPAFDVQQGYDVQWLFYYFSRQHFYEQLESYSSGSGSKRVQPKALFKMLIKAPSYDEQRKIAAVLSASDREIDQLTQKLNAYKLQKKGLMQQLLTGKKRVSIATSEAA